MAWQFDRADTGEGVVQAFRRKLCPIGSIVLKLRGLEPGALYEPRDLDGGAPRQVQGRELLETGLKATAAKRAAAMVFKYRRLR